MFKKKKDEQPEQPQEPTETIKTDSSENNKKESFVIKTEPLPEKVNEEVPEAKGYVEYYINKYHLAFAASATTTPAQAELQNLLFGILTELKELKDLAAKSFEEDE